MWIIEVEVLLPVETDQTSYFHCELAQDSFVFILRIPCELDESIFLL